MTSCLTRGASPQLAQARLRMLKKKKAEEDAKAKVEQQVRSRSNDDNNSDIVMQALAIILEKCGIENIF